MLDCLKVVFPNKRLDLDEMKARGVEADEQREDKQRAPRLEKPKPRTAPLKAMDERLSRQTLHTKEYVNNSTKKHSSADRLSF
jgi:hypothetical protein